MKNYVKRIISVLLSSAVLCGAMLLSGCDNSAEKKSNKILSLPGNSSNTNDGTSSSTTIGTSSAASPETSSSSGDEKPAAIDRDYSHNEEQTPTAPVDVASDAIFICSLSEALANFSEIESKAADGTPEEIVKTLLERNILCFATMQGKCWTYDESKYADNYEFSHGMVPIQSKYLSSTKQIDDLFYSTYITSKADYLIHYDDGDMVYDAFDNKGGLRADFSQILKNAMDSFSTPTYAAVVSASDYEIVFERYSVPYTVEGAPSPNNFQFSAVKRGGKWRLENYIIDVPAYSKQYGSLILTGRKGNPNIEKIAMTEVGNFDGTPYWNWCGYDFPIEWCAAFVSWCYGQAGLKAPVFVAVNSEGIPWFKERGQWADADYRDIAPGDCIFFDWENDGRANHVGLVIGTDGKRVYTIEGNRSDACQQFVYDLDDPHIFGYGLMNWN